MLGGEKGSPLPLERERGGERTYAPLHVAGRLHLYGIGVVVAAVSAAAAILRGFQGGPGAGILALMWPR